MRWPAQRDRIVVSREQYGDRWPFAAYQDGTVRCEERSFEGTERPLVTIAFNDETYGLNGAAFGVGGYADARDLLSREPVLGSYNLGAFQEFIDVGLALCEGSEAAAAATAASLNASASLLVETDFVTLHLDCMKEAIPALINLSEHASHAQRVEYRNRMYTECGSYFEKARDRLSAEGGEAALDIWYALNVQPWQVVIAKYEQAFSIPPVR